MNGPVDYELNRSRLPRQACEFLCTKTMYMATHDPDLIEEFPQPHERTAYFWCAKNQMPFGEDDQLVSPETCLPHRACWSSRFPELPPEA
jgi:hypothetical protein